MAPTLSAGMPLMSTLHIGNAGECQRNTRPKYGCTGMPGIGATACTSIPTTLSSSLAAMKFGMVAPERLTRNVQHGHGAGQSAAADARRHAVADRDPVVELLGDRARCPPERRRDVDDVGIRNVLRHRNRPPV